MSYNGRSGLHFHDGGVNSKYQDAVIQSFLVRDAGSTRGSPALYDKEYLNLDPKVSYTFQQDGASCHMSNSTEEWLEQNLPDHWIYCGRGSWVASSPDLSIIENVWAILQDRVVAREAFDEDKLGQVLEEEWWALEQSVIQKPFDRIGERMALVVKNMGGRFRMPHW